MKPTKENQHVIVIGGGITGLSVAWRLQQSDQGATSITLLESEDRWGGKLETVSIPGLNGDRFTIDAGPESFITRKPEVWELAQELGLQNRVSDPGSETKGIYILHDGVPVPVPLAPLAFLRSPILSIPGKMRLMAEPFIRARRDNQDESLSDFASRRLGQEASERFISPILAGIYNTNPEHQSILTTSPIMREMEKEYGGLFKGALGRAMAGRKTRSNGTPRPRFITFKNGAGELVDALLEKLEVNLRRDSKVTQLNINEKGYEVILEGGESLPADVVILATPANISAKILADSAPKASMALSKIQHVNIGTISLAYREEDVPADITMNGLMIPRKEACPLDAVTWTSQKMPERTPDGYTMLRAFFGGSHPELVAIEEWELLDTVQKEIKSLFGIKTQPILAKSFRWPNSYPQADVGHLDSVTKIEGFLPTGVFVTGSSYRGIGVPDCIRQGYHAADKAIQYLETT